MKIDFVGVFDTVSSVGMLGKKLPFASTNYGIRIFRHAMALDEHRARFKVAHWTKSPVDDDDDASSTPSWRKKQKRLIKGHGQQWKEVEDVETDVKEVWFSGCHVSVDMFCLHKMLKCGKKCDVGGGSVKNDRPNCLAKIPLRW